MLLNVFFLGTISNYSAGFGGNYVDLGPFSAVRVVVHVFTTMGGLLVKLELEIF